MRAAAAASSLPVSAKREGMERRKNAPLVDCVHTYIHAVVKLFPLHHPAENQDQWFDEDNRGCRNVTTNESRFCYRLIIEIMINCEPKIIFQKNRQDSMC